MADSINNLLELADLAQQSGPKEIAQWFDAGISKWMNNGGTLEQALGLTCAPGKRSARGQYLKHKQRQHLREAWNTLEGPPTPRARKLSEAIKVFETRYWPAWCDRDEPPPGASQLRAALFRARQHGKLPAERQLFELMKSMNAASSVAWFSKSLV